MNNRFLVFVFVLFICIATGMIAHVRSLQENVLESSAIESAKIYSDAIVVFRELYTSEVVKAVKNSNLEITHDYINKKAIPLPVTLSIKMGEKIGERGTGAIARMYSPFPFPWREESGGLKDDFGIQAWEYLTQFPDKAYYVFSQPNGKKMLRYAVADIMQPACIDCHNNHQDSKRNDWKVGDLRGVLEINVPLDDIVEKTDADLRITILSYIVLSILGIIGIIILIRKHKQEADEFERLSITDSLTGLFNRRQFELALDRELKVIKRNKKPLSLIYFDIDHFKQINDAGGHVKGDEVLKYIGSSLLDLVREIDTACRIGGDEFGVILPDCNSENAKLVCQRLINKFHEQYPEYNLSIGLTQTKADTVPTHDEFIKLADERMYLAKKQPGSYICADDKSEHDT